VALIHKVDRLCSRTSIINGSEFGRLSSHHAHLHTHDNIHTGCLTFFGVHFRFWTGLGCMHPKSSIKATACMRQGDTDNTDFRICKTANHILMASKCTVQQRRVACREKQSLAAGSEMWESSPTLDFWP
jgi:hypothetical protein